MMGERLRELRKSKKITQEELAEVLNIQKSTISLYETGKSDPSDEVKNKIARYFKISLDYLAGIIDEEIGYYDKNSFLKLPAGISAEDKSFLDRLVEFIEHQIKNDK
jgi:transcriptional regulator with XRE-family HTH domain